MMPLFLAYGFNMNHNAALIHRKSNRIVYQSLLSSKAKAYTGGTIFVGDHKTQTNTSVKKYTSFVTSCTTFLFSLSILLLSSTTLPEAAFAKDFAGKNISNQDFSGQDLSGRDFTKAVATNTKFVGANLEGAIFKNTNLEKADFSNANLQKADLTDAILDGSIFKEVTAQKATLSKTILDIGDLENVDFTSAIWPSKWRIMICDMDELKGTNTVTGVDSKASFYCQSQAFSN